MMKSQDRGSTEERGSILLALTSELADVFFPPCLSCLRNPRSHFFLWRERAVKMFDHGPWFSAYALLSDFSYSGVMQTRQPANTRAGEAWLGQEGDGTQVTPPPH
jgi:hypothetical protein